jgi:hypothetical protein
VDTGGGANCGLELLLAEALVVGKVVDQDRVEYAACWGSLGQPVLLAEH